MQKNYAQDPQETKYLPGIIITINNNNKKYARHPLLGLKIGKFLYDEYHCPENPDQNQFR